jgi:hypothetical protein
MLAARLKLGLAEVNEESRRVDYDPADIQITILAIFMMTRHPPFFEETMNDYRCI